MQRRGWTTSGRGCARLGPSSLQFLSHGMRDECGTEGFGEVKFWEECSVASLAVPNSQFQFEHDEEEEQEP